MESWLSNNGRRALIATKVTKILMPINAVVEADWDWLLLKSQFEAKITFLKKMWKKTRWIQYC